MKIKLYLEVFIHFMLIRKSISHSHYSKTSASWICYELKVLNCIYVLYYPCICVHMLLWWAVYML